MDMDSQTHRWTWAEAKFIRYQLSCLLALIFVLEFSLKYRRSTFHYVGSLKATNTRSRHIALLCNKTLGFE